MRGGLTSVLIQAAAQVLRIAWSTDCWCCCWLLMLLLHPAAAASSSQHQQQQQHASRFMDAGSFMRACQPLRMRACVRRAYCK
jgi:hypothetical protein